MKITILDGYSVTRDDLNWDRLADLGDLTVYERTPADKTVERARGSEIVFTNKVVLDGDTLRQLPGLKYIGILATGYNIVDIAVAKELGIVVTNIPSYSTPSVAQTVFALLLTLTNRAEHYSEEFHDGEWSRCKDFCYANTNLIELENKKLGIVGFGHIGQRVARIARAFGMEVFVSSSKPQSELPEVVKMDIGEIFRTCDVISLHCPLAPDTFHMANAERIGSMRKSAFLINTARGPLVDEHALAEALKAHKIAGAGLDVLEQEPPREDNPLIDAPNCIVTPHIAWSTVESRKRLLDMAISNLKAFLQGSPVNVVD